MGDDRYLRCDRCGDATALSIVNTPEGEHCPGLRCPVHTHAPLPCPTCESYIAAGL